jgi:hypothetical protein
MSNPISSPLNLLKSTDAFRATPKSYYVGWVCETQSAVPSGTALLFFIDFS